MGVLIAIHGFLPNHRAGAERAAERIARYLISINQDVEVFALDTYDSPQVRLETDTYQSITCHRLHYDISGSGFMNPARFENPDVAAAFREVLSQGQYDLVHVVSGYLLGGQVLDIAHEFGIPVVVTLTEYWFMCGRLNLLQEDGTLCSGPDDALKCTLCTLEERRRYRLPKKYLPEVANKVWQIVQTPAIQHQLELVKNRQANLTAALNRADLVISPSEFLVSKFREFGFDTRNWIVIRHGVDGLSLSDDTDDAPSPTLRVGFIGQLKPHKGLDLIIDAVLDLLSEGRNLSLDIWGVPSPSHYLTRLKARSRSSPRIRWRGGFQSDALAQVFGELDVVVIPSRWYENCPTVILESYRMGTPVIATRLGGMVELVGQDQGGLSFELNNVDDLTAKIRSLLDDPTMLPRLRQNIPYVKTGNEEVAEIVSHYERLTNGHKV